MEGSGITKIKWCSLSHAPRGEGNHSKTNKQHRITSNRIEFLHAMFTLSSLQNGQGSCGFIKTVAELASFHDYYGTIITFCIGKQARKIDNVNTAAIS